MKMLGGINQMIETTNTGKYKLIYKATLANNKIIFEDKETLSQELNLLNEGTIEITIKNWYQKRTNQQNKLMWLWFTIIGNHIGHSPEQVKGILQYKFLRIEETIENTGEIVERIKGTSELNSLEMKTFLDEVNLWSNEYLSCSLPNPTTHEENDNTTGNQGQND